MYQPVSQAKNESLQAVKESWVEYGSLSAHWTKSHMHADMFNITPCEHS